MSSYSEGQIHQLANAFEAAGFTPDDITKLGQFQDLSGFRGVVRGSHEIKPIGGKIIIVRGHFNPIEFIGHGWKIIWDETDIRSTTLTEIDLSKVQFATMLKGGEIHIGGEEKLRRLKKKFIRLDAGVFFMLWQNQCLIPERWKEGVNGRICNIFFDGTILCSPSGRRCVLFLSWLNDRWFWDFRLLHDVWYASDLSAVLDPSLIQAA